MRYYLRRGIRRIWVPAALRFWPLAVFWYRRWGLELAGHPDDRVWYFAYGSNMHDSAFRERRRMRPDICCAGMVRGYRLRFNLDGRPRGRSAPANLGVDAEAEVWGVLYRITRRELVRLNASEGVPGRNYQPVTVTACDSSGQFVEAVTYMARGKETDGNPSLRYLTLLREGARAHGLPDHWIAMLDSVKHAE